MTKPELLAPAGSFSSLTAAVSAGADAVYVGGKQFSARASAKNFESFEIEKAIDYCHENGVKLYAAINTLVTDRELDSAIEQAKTFYLGGADGFIIQDIGLADILMKTMPEIKYNASTQMGIHNLDGALYLKEKGFDRVVLARELSEKDIRTISEKSGIETEIFVHGALCMCFSGSCYMSSLIGGRSGNRGACAQPCRLMYEKDGKKDYCLSLKDLYLGDKLDRIMSTNVSSLKIEGRMKSSTYVYETVKAYRDALDGGKPDKERLAFLFSRQGFTSGYFDGNTGRHMFGYRSEEDKKNTKKISASDMSIKSCERLPITVKKRAVDHVTFKKRYDNRKKIPDLELSFLSISQIPKEHFDKTIWLSFYDAVKNPLFFEYAKKGIINGIVLPSFVQDSLNDDFINKLTYIKNCGINKVLCGNAGIGKCAEKLGFDVHGDYNLNITNTASVKVLKDTYSSLTLSYELSFPQIRDMGKYGKCGIIGYGRLPVMVTKNCIMKTESKCHSCKNNIYLKDRVGKNFFVRGEYGCLNMMYNADVLYIADMKEYKDFGLSFVRLCFTDENKSTVNNVINNFMSGKKPVGSFTRGRYNK